MQLPTPLDCINKTPFRPPAQGRPRPPPQADPAAVPGVPEAAELGQLVRVIQASLEEITGRLERIDSFSKSPLDVRPSEAAEALPGR